MFGSEAYNFHLVFRGLFRCELTKGVGGLTRADIYLPEARSRNKSQSGQILGEHRALLEFSPRDVASTFDLWNERFTWVRKRWNSPEVCLYDYSDSDLRVRLSGKTKGENSKIDVIGDGKPGAFSRLPNLSEIAGEDVPLDKEVADEGRGCVARVLDLDVGWLGSERPSSVDGKEMIWYFDRPYCQESLLYSKANLDLIYSQVDSAERAGRTINLDARWSIKVPAGETVVLQRSGLGGTGGQQDILEFRGEVGGDVEVWVKNRELDAILKEDNSSSDDTCGAYEADFDFELHYTLGEPPSGPLIPYSLDFLNRGLVDAAACGCGGCTGGGG